MFMTRIIPAVVAFAMTACAAPQKAPTLQLQPETSGPKAAPQRNLTHFAEGLRCMDDMLYSFGVRDVSVMIEDMQDQVAPARRRHPRHDGIGLRRHDAQELNWPKFRRSFQTLMARRAGQ